MCRMSTLLASMGMLLFLRESRADAFFVVMHNLVNGLMTTRLDPIITPGGVSAHVHSIVGSSAFQPDYTYANSVSGTCTTANVNVDKSNYWTPQLYRKQDDGTLMAVKMNRVNTYYFMRRFGDEQIHEFPSTGFKLLGGYPFRTTFDPNDRTNTAITYTCLGAPGQPVTNGFPTMSCPTDMRAEVTFPNCWNGVDEWLEGSAHVAYDVGTKDFPGACPATHPIRIPTLFYEFHYFDDYPYEAGRRVWAQGDDLGFGFHGDFTNGWPTGLLQSVIEAGDSCGVLFELGGCLPLKDYFTGTGPAAACAPDHPDVVVNEDIGLTAPIAQLPGTNPIFGSTGPAPPQGAPASPGGGGGSSPGGADPGSTSPSAPPSPPVNPSAPPPAGSASAPAAAGSASAPAVSAPPYSSPAVSPYVPPVAVPPPPPPPPPPSPSATDPTLGKWGGHWGRRWLIKQW